MFGLRRIEKKPISGRVRYDNASLLKAVLDILRIRPFVLLLDLGRPIRSGDRRLPSSSSPETIFAMMNIRGDGCTPSIQLFNSINRADEQLCLRRRRSFSAEHNTFQRILFAPH